MVKSQVNEVGATSVENKAPPADRNKSAKQNNTRQSLGAAICVADTDGGKLVGALSKFLLKVEEVEVQWQYARQTALHSVNSSEVEVPDVAEIDNNLSYSPVKSNRKGKSSTPSFAPTKPARYLIRQVLGVQPVVGRFSQQTDAPMDLPRLHALQRDLVDFSQLVLVWAEQLNYSSLDTLFEQSSINALPTSINTANQLRAAQQIHTRACELLIHLAYIAPITPIAIGSPYSSHITGVESLVEEVII